MVVTRGTVKGLSLVAELVGGGIAGVVLRSFENPSGSEGPPNAKLEAAKKIGKSAILGARKDLFPSFFLFSVVFHR